MTEIKSKNDFSYYAGRLNNEISNYIDSTMSFDNFVSGLEAVDGIDPTILGRNISNKLKNLGNEGQTIANNIKNYIKDIEELDQYDHEISFNTDNYNIIGTETNNINSIIKTDGIISEFGNTPQSSKKDIKIYKGKNDTDISKYNNDVDKGFNVTTDNIAYELDEEDEKILGAIVTLQSDNSYDDSLAVASLILNRSENPSWIKTNGRDPMLQATAKNEFLVYNNGEYKKYLNNIPKTVSTAVKDCLNGVRNHKYLEMNSYVEFSNNYISKTGNRFK